MSAAHWWAVGVPIPEAVSTAESAALTHGSGPYSPYQYTIDVAAKQRWWFLLAGLAVGAGVMHWQMKRRMKRKRGHK